MTILREWRAELRRELADEYVAYIRDTGLAEYLATPGNLGALSLATRQQRPPARLEFGAPHHDAPPARR